MLNNMSVILAWRKYTYININMQIVYALLWSSYSIYYKLRDKYLKQQPIWTDMKAIMFYHFRPTRYERDY